MRLQRRQSTRLPRPWDSPGKNTGVGCHLLHMRATQCKKWLCFLSIIPDWTSHWWFAFSHIDFTKLQLYFLFHWLAAAAKSLQSCPTLCDPTDSSPPGPALPGILQARTLEWVAISSSNAWKWKVKVKSLSRVRLLATPWTTAYQAPLSMGFSRQEYWSGLPLPSPSIGLIP